MSTPQQRKEAATAPEWTAEQSVAFIRALEAWQAREGLTHSQAAARLGVSDVHLGQWLAGNRTPKREEVVLVLERTA